MIGVVVPTLNQFELLAKALASIKSKKFWQPFIIPNWELNLGCAQSWNKGVKEAISTGCDYILIINDDIVCSPWTLDALVNRLENNDDCVLVSANNKNGELTPEEVMALPKPTEQHISDHPDFSCFMIRPSTIEKIGWFDEGFERAYFEDNDYHYRIQLAGLKAQATTLAPYYHYGSSTQNSVPQGVVPGDLFMRNQAYFVRKWGDVPGREAFLKPFNDSSKTWRDV